jgi:hypothetical protein
VVESDHDASIIGHCSGIAIAGRLREPSEHREYVKPHHRQRSALAGGEPEGIPPRRGTTEYEAREAERAKEAARDKSGDKKTDPQ